MKKTLVLVMFILILYNLNSSLIISLSEARDQLLQNNPEYLAKESSLRSAEWEMREAFTAMLPSASLQAGYNRLEPRPFVGAQENYSFSYSLVLNQPLFLGGRLWLSYRIRRDAVKIARADLESTRLTLLSELEEAYYNYLLTKDLYLINQSAREIALRNMSIAHTRLEEGTISRADFLQLQAELTTREVALLQAENNREISYRQLQNLIKIEDFDLLPVDFTEYEELTTYFQEIMEQDREEIRQRLVDHGTEHNPSLIMSRSAKEISNKRISISAGNFLPSINFRASRNWTDNFSGETDFDGSTTYVLSASLPIFPLIDNYSSYRSSYHSYRRALRDAESAEDGIRLAIEAAFYSGAAAAKMITSAELALQYAEETYEMMEERFRSGLISSVDLISIELLLTNSRLTAVNTKYDFLKSRSALMNLLGIEEDEFLLQVMSREP